MRPPTQRPLPLAVVALTIAAFTAANPALDGTKLTEWGGGVESEKPGEFVKCPHGIWLDSKGDLYVSEVQADARLQKFVRQ